MAEPRQAFTVRVPLDFDQETRDLVADDILQFILRRTERGLDKDNAPFKKYSTSYSESLDFKIAGKSKNHVDLQLSGDMLTELQILNTSVTGFITIGFEAGTEENDRAAWQRNNLKPGFPKRDFLGIADEDLAKIISPYKRIVARKVAEETEIKKRVSSEASKIIANFLFNR